MRTSDGDVSVPIIWAYNHHFEAYIKGALSEVRKTTQEESHKVGHSYGHDQWHVFKNEDIVDPTPDSSIPVAQWFSEGNGGEYRKSFHGYPKGMAQLVESPVSFQIEPMQIDTRNRNYNGTDFKAGILPASSAAPPNASYSGLLECPCATSIPKNISVTYTTENKGSCPTEVHNAKECLEAAENIWNKPISQVLEVNNPALPSGCSSITYDNGTIVVYYNTIEEQEMPYSMQTSGSLYSKAAEVTVKLVLDSATSTASITLTGVDGVWFGVGFNAPNFLMSDLPYSIIVDGNGVVTERKMGDHGIGELLIQSLEIKSNSVEGGFRTVMLERSLMGKTDDHYTFDASSSSIPLIFASGKGPDLAFHGIFNRSGGTLVLAESQWLRLKSSGLNSGTLTSEAAAVTVKVELDTSRATISLTSIDGIWFGVAFNAPNFLMADLPYAIIVDGNGAVTERKLGTHVLGDLLSNSLSVISNSATGGKRTVVVERSLVGATSDHYTFDATATSIPLLFASGMGPDLAYHGPQRRDGGTLTLSSLSNNSPKLTKHINVERGLRNSGTLTSDAASVTVTVELDTSKAKISLSGIDGAWFGVAFNAPNFLMADLPYAIVVDGNGVVTERKLGTHVIGDLLSNSLSVVSNTAVAGKRTLVVERSLVGATSDHYTFDAMVTSIPLLFASGTGPDLDFHGPKQREGGTLTLSPQSSISSNLINDINGKCGGGEKFYGTQASEDAKVTVILGLDSSTSKATITLSGPNGVWYGVGINAGNFLMSDKPYTIVVDGNGNVSELKVGNHAPGNILKQSIKTITNTVSDGIRTVTMVRDFNGISTDHYTFDSSISALPLIFASGTSSTFSYHGSKTRSGGTLHLAAINNPTCICYEGVKGTINGIPFSKNCLAEPKGDLLAQKNPTCFVDTYQGGLACCHHQVVLLDKEQVQPKEEMTYHMKFRFWFQEYKEEAGIPSHKNLIRIYWQTEALAGEYDVLKCPDSTPRDQCVFEIKSNFTVRDMMANCDVRTNPGCWGDTSKYKGINLIYAAGHCHAPSCLSMELYNADTNELLCRHDPVYGKTHETFDELGYLTLPPCLYGSLEDGLNPPTFLSYDTNLYSIKRNNNTAAHYGEMASWQMRGILVNN